MANEPIERDVETLIDLQLQKLGWVDNPKSEKRNVWKQQPMTSEEKTNLTGLRPDYILYESNTNNPLIIIEAKRPNREIIGALIQGLEYAKKINAPIVIATNGIIIKAIRIKTGNALILDNEEVDSFFNENIALKFIENDSVVTIEKKVIESRAELIKIFKESNNLLRKEGLTAGHERFSVFTNILFLKLMSEIEDLKGESSTVPKEYKWDFFKKKKGLDLLSYINDTVLKHFNTFYKNDSESIFDKLKINNSNTLEDIIKKLDQLQLTNIDADIKGDAFEYFLKTYNSGEKDLGEYFTPRHIVNFLVKLVNPKFGETVYDPFCGTGGILISAFFHIKKSMPNNHASLKFLKENSVFGREISTTAKIAKMNMILIGDGHNNIKRIDTLSKPIDGEYDVVITNMPFSQETEHGNLYDIPSKDANSICVQHCIKAISSTSENGRIGIIVPEKVLFDKSYELLRERIYKTCRINNIISLPSGSFEPYTNVQTSIIYLTKVNQKIKNESVKFTFIKNDGFSLDKVRKKLHGINDLEYFFSEPNKLFSLDIPIDKIKNNKYILQGKKYILPKELAEITFNTKKLIRLGDFLAPIPNRLINIELADEYALLGVKSYGLGVFKKNKKGYELTSSMSYYKVQADCLFWCKVDTKNGAFAVIEDEHKDCIITSNFNLLKIDTTKILPYFLEILFRNKKVQEYFDNYISGSTNRKYVKVSELMNFYLPFYDLDYQKYIIKHIQKQENTIKINQEKINEQIINIILPNA